MRVFGRLPPDEFGNRPWRVVETDAANHDDYVHVTALAQCLKLNLGESPFFANFGIPAKGSLQTQVAPDLAVAFTQVYYSQFFASLIVARVANAPQPTYNVSVTRTDGSVFSAEVAV